jgi:hypothetical protein
MLKPAIAIFFAACAAVALPQRVRAQAVERTTTTVRATIVRIEDGDVFLDVGRDQLAGTRKLTVYRRVTVRHPITRKSLADRFAIGELEIVQAGDALTLARAAAAPSRPFGIGDGAEASVSVVPPVAQVAAPAKPAAGAPPAAPDRAVQAAAPATSAAPAAAAPATPAIAGAPAEAGELLRYFQATLAQPPEHRVRVYDTYLQRHPRSAYRAFIDQEIRYLRAWEQNGTESADDSAAAERAALLASAVEFLPPEQLPSGKAAALALMVRPEAEVRGLVLYVRGKGPDSGDYRPLSMQLDGRGHAHARVPEGFVRPPGLEFFIEAVNQRGETASAFASALEPHVIEVASPHVPAERRREPAMRVRISSELASFDGTSGRDYFLINEGDFFYRMRHGHLYGIRMGYGRYDGEGGTVEELDELELEPRPAGFTYAFFEGEFTLTELLGLALRGTLGLGRPDPGEQGDLAGGFQTRLRIGEPTATHLVIAGELLPEIGQRAFLYLGWELIDRVPMAAEVQVTDQPVNSDELAVRIVYEVGYRITDRMALALRPSYQLRTIRHAGPGVGLSATFDW